jgi:hypothetical protein
MPRSPWPAGPRREAAILQRLGRATLGARGDGALRRVNCTTACSSLRYRADTTTRSPTLGPACSPCNTPTPSRIPGPQTQPRPHTPSPRTWRRPAGRRRRPALRAGPTVRPPRFARRGPTKEAIDGRSISQTDSYIANRAKRGDPPTGSGEASTGADGRPRCDHAASGGLPAGPGAEELRSWRVRRYRWRSWPAEPRRS